MSGAVGADMAGLITAVADSADVQPSAFVTMKVYVPDGIPETVVFVPVPLIVTPSGYLVRVHCPGTGNPFNKILPL